MVRYVLNSRAEAPRRGSHTRSGRPPGRTERGRQPPRPLCRARGYPPWERRSCCRTPRQTSSCQFLCRRQAHRRQRDEQRQRRCGTHASHHHGLNNRDLRRGWDHKQATGHRHRNHPHQRVVDSAIRMREQPDARRPEHQYGQDIDRDCAPEKLPQRFAPAS